MELGKIDINLIENLLKDEDKVIINNESTDMKRIRKLEEAIKTKPRKTKDYIFFYDDVIQYTTLGLIDTILELRDDIVDKKLDYDLFFYRPFEHSDYIVFIKEIFKSQFNVELEESYIREVNEKYYPYILKKSPAAAFFRTLIRMEATYKSVTICYRYNFKGMDKFTESIKHFFTGNKKIPIYYDSLSNYDNSEYNFLKKNSEFDILAIQHAGRAIDFIEDTKKAFNVVITPNVHNGLSSNYISLYCGIFGKTCGPYNTELVIYNEGLYIA